MRSKEEFKMKIMKKEKSDSCKINKIFLIPCDMTIKKKHEK